MNADRTRLVCGLLLAASVALTLFLFLTAHGTLDYLGRPLGTDFSDVYAAGWMADHGHAAAAWSWPEHYRVQQTLHQSPSVPFFAWHYPPPFLLLAAALAKLPYLPALGIWLSSTLGLALLMARKILPGRGTLLAVLAAPASYVCFAHGQNAFLTASLLGGALLLLDRKPLLAGLLLGCLVYKPQFAVLLPILLIAAWKPRAFVGAAISSVGLIILTIALWGLPVWAAFFNSLALTRTVIIESGNTGWEKIVTSFATMRGLGTPVPLAYAAQSLSTGLAIIAVIATARWAHPRIRNAVVCSAALLSTPYALDYDLVILGAGILFLIADARERGWLPYEKSLLALAYLTPLYGRQLAYLTHVPIDWMAICTIFAIALRRGAQLDRLPSFRTAACFLRSSPSRHSHAGSAR